MNIMYLTDVGFDTPNANNRLIISMLQEFMENGNNVYLVQSHSTGIYEDVPEILKNNPNFFYDTVKKKNVKKTDFVKRYLNGIKYQFDAKKKWKKKIQDIDVILLQSHYTAWVAAYLLKKYKIKIFFNIYDIFPGDAYINGNIKSKFIYNCFSLLQKYLYKKCDMFFTLTEDTKKTLVNLGVKINNISIIPNWFDNKKIFEIPANKNRFIKKYNLDFSKKYIQYAGTIGVSYDFGLILKLAKQLSYRSDIIFQIVGEGLFLEDIKKEAKNMALTNVQFLPWQSEEIISDVYSAATLQIVPLKRDVIKNSYPSKILPLMGCSRVPIISVEEDSFFYKEINEKKVGFACPSGDIDKLKEKILYLIDNPEVLEEYQNNAYRYVNEKFTSIENTKKMLDEFKKILRSK